MNHSSLLIITLNHLNVGAIAQICLGNNQNQLISNRPAALTLKPSRLRSCVCIVALNIGMCLILVDLGSNMYGHIYIAATSCDVDISMGLTSSNPGGSVTVARMVKSSALHLCEQICFCLSSSLGLRGFDRGFDPPLLSQFSPIQPRFESAPLWTYLEDILSLCLIL